MVVLELQRKHENQVMIIQDVDSTHVFVSEDALKMIQERIQELQEENDHIVYHGEEKFKKLNKQDRDE